MSSKNMRAKNNFLQEPADDVTAIVIRSDKYKNDLRICAFNNNHKISEQKFLKHQDNCPDRKYWDHKFTRCSYAYSHMVKTHALQKHEKTCPQKIEHDKFQSYLKMPSTTPLFNEPSFFNEDNEDWSLPEESEISNKDNDDKMMNKTASVSNNSLKNIPVGLSIDKANSNRIKSSTLFDLVDQVNDMGSQKEINTKDEWTLITNGKKKKKKP